jgi:TolB-like protein/tetratricopeptide (TPR) repeat protein
MALGNERADVGGAFSALLVELAAAPPEPTEDWQGLRPGERVGRFEMVRELGRGGFGVVYEARDLELGRAVAFKTLRTGTVTGAREERLLREAEAAARLSHPNIVTLFEVGRFEHGPYLVLELLRGQTLAERLTHGPLPLREALRIAGEVAKGLAHAHAQGVVHRDLTPGNVFLCEDGQVKILDLGMAHAFGRTKVEGGTRSYMAPEQARGAPEDQRTDVFALGVLLHQMLSGRLPFATRDGLEDESRAPGLEVQGVPALGALVGRMLEKDPVLRPRDAGEVAPELEAIRETVARAAASTGGVAIRRAGLGELLGELKRRRVFRALLGWGVVSFAVLQVAEPVMHGLNLPEWVLSVVVVLLAMGFPLTVALSWIYDLTRQGVRRTEVNPTEAMGRTPRGRRLAALLGAVGLVAAAPGVAWYLWKVRPARVAATPGDASAAVAPSIAVLAFADMSPQHDQEYFADGIAEEILNALAQVEGLRVVGRTSSFAFKGRSEDLRAIGQRLNVATVLEGSVRKEEGRVRVTAQLVKVADGFHLWSRTYDRELKGVLAMQEEIAHGVVDVLRVKLVPGLASPPSDRPPRDPRAYNEYLLGRRFENQASQAELLRAAASYERALALDPGFAEAAARLAIVRYDYADNAEVPTEAATTEGMRQAMAAAEKAIALDPRSATGHAIRAYLRAFTQWDWAGAQDDVARAIELNPGDSRAQFTQAQLLQCLGRLPEAIGAMRRALDIDPLSSTHWWTLSYMHVGLGQFDEARAAATRSMEVAPEDSHGPRNLGLAYVHERRFAEAALAFEKCTSPGHRLLGAALVQHGLGRERESRRALEELVARYHHSMAYQVAQAHAWRGEVDQAFHWLDRAYAQHDSGLADYVKYDPFLRQMRADPRYTALLRKMNLPVK